MEGKLYQNPATAASAMPGYMAHAHKVLPPCPASSAAMAATAPQQRPRHRSNSSGKEKLIRLIELRMR